MDLRDNSNLGAFVTSQLIDGLRQEWEQQIVNGSGTAPNLRGLLNTSGIVTQALVTDATATIRRAITTLQGGGLVPAFAVVSASDWEAIEVAANAKASAIDYRGLPVDSQTQRLFGLPVILSNILPAKVGLVIAQDSVVVDTDGVLDVKWSDADGGFASNTLTARVETRIGLSVTRPSGVVKIATAA
jgi:HK97 family phage major capsid protein